jgi:IS30 family transposase
LPWPTGRATPSPRLRPFAEKIGEGGDHRRQHEPDELEREARSGIEVYFCDPHAPWQRGSNENTSGLLGQYFPKGTDFAAVSEADLDGVADELNDRPRKRLGFYKPIERIGDLLFQ